MLDGKMTPRFVAQQLSHPAGFGGKIIRFLMNHGNAALNRFAADQLMLQPNDRVLEIGFGGGAVLRTLLSQARFVCGIDRSEDVIASARHQFSAEIDSKNADFRLGSIEDLPLSSGSFDKVLSVHTVYFWTSLERGTSEIKRVLAPGGRAVIGFIPKARMDLRKMPPDIFSTRAPEDISEALRNAGFDEVELLAVRDPDGAMIATGVTPSKPT